MDEEKTTEIKIIYELDIDEEEDDINGKNKEDGNIENKDAKKIRIFGQGFVKNNKDKCKIIYNNKEYELQEFFQIDKILEIKLKGDIINMSCLFAECIYLKSLPDISKIKPTENMSYLFYSCINLENLDDISKWDMSNVKYIQGMFSGCLSLVELPDISEWNTENIILMGGLFSNYDSLNPLMNYEKNCKEAGIFSSCRALEKLPDISKWNTSQVINMSYIFSDCLILNSLPDISNWDTSKVKDMSIMFADCRQLFSLPDISIQIKLKI